MSIRSENSKPKQTHAQNLELNRELREHITSTINLLIYSQFIVETSLLRGEARKKHHLASAALQDITLVQV
jgi:hypothetical protein